MGESDNATEPVGPSDLRDRLAAANGTNVLVVGRPMSGKQSFGLSVLARAAGSGRDVLLVTGSRRITSIPFDPAEAGRFGVVDCTPSSVEEEGPVVDVGSPGDLTGISMPVSRFLDGARDPVLLLDSISSVLQYADEEPTFRFLSVLTSNVAADGGVGLYTFDEGVHPEATFRTFSQLFDGRAELRDDGVSADASTGPGPDGGTSEVRVSGVAGIANEWVRISPD